MLPSRHAEEMVQPLNANHNKDRMMAFQSNREYKNPKPTNRTMRNEHNIQRIPLKWYWIHERIVGRQGGLIKYSEKT